MIRKMLGYKTKLQMFFGTYQKVVWSDMESFTKYFMKSAIKPNTRFCNTKPL